MKFFISLILLSLTGSALSGAPTGCGSIQTNYMLLLQGCEVLLNGTLDFVNSKSSYNSII
jgi:hypothetical protein